MTESEITEIQAAIDNPNLIVILANGRAIQKMDNQMKGFDRSAYIICTIGTPAEIIARQTIAIDRQKDFDDRDEIYCDWYKCPSCGHKYITSGDNYCPNCGCRFEWSGNGLKLRG